MMLMLPALFPALFLSLQCTPSLTRRLPCVRMSANDIDGAVQVSKLPTAAQLCSAADEEVAGLTDLVWTAICGQAAAASSSPVLAPFFQTTISSQSTQALAPTQPSCNESHDHAVDPRPVLGRLAHPARTSRFLCSS